MSIFCFNKADISQEENVKMEKSILIFVRDVKTISKSYFHCFSKYSERGQFFLDPLNNYLLKYDGKAVARMSIKAISEATGKELINRHLLPGTKTIKEKFVTITENTNWEKLIEKNPWLKTKKLAVKPDQLIKRRAKLGLVKIDADLDTVQNWISERMNKQQKVGRVTGKLRKFIIQPFVPHTQEEETYVCIYSHRQADTILFHQEGGTEVGDVDSIASKFEVPIGTKYFFEKDLIDALLSNVADNKKVAIARFIASLYRVYVDLYFSFLEINPLVVKNDGIYIVDLAAKIDSSAEYFCKKDWGQIDFPLPFGRDAFPEEKYISDLDAGTGASLKLTILNPNGKIWTMIAGTGAAVVYADTIVDLGGIDQLANYGEVAGNTNEVQIYEYVKTIINLMTREKDPQGKILIIGGAIASSNNVATTSKGIVTAFTEFKDKLVDNKITIFVRKAGPNYQEGLSIMRNYGVHLGIPIHVFGPETHMTAICAMALGSKPIPIPETQGFSKVQYVSTEPEILEPRITPRSEKLEIKKYLSKDNSDFKDLFTDKTSAIFWGMHPVPIQAMLDFDFVCKREQYSVVAVICPFNGGRKRKFYFGLKEIFIPVYKYMKNAMIQHPEAEVLISYASLRSTFEVILDVLEFPQIKTISVMAEGIPDNLTRKMIVEAKKKNVTIIGPASVGGIKAGCFRIGETAGMMDNILDSKLYRPGSIAYVIRSGGLANEMNNIISKASNGVYEGISIGGDRYPVSSFLDHIMRFEKNPEVKIIILLGEIGGVEEYDVCEALQEKMIKKPLIAWCIGTCANYFRTEVEFGHAGSQMLFHLQAATSKNEALQRAGAFVPDSFDELEELINYTYKKLLENFEIIPKPEVAPPTVPMDYSWAKNLGLVRKHTSFITSISDDRGSEMIYAGMPLTEIFKKDIGIGGVISLLWFQKLLPDVYCKFLELMLILVADYGPGVSSAHNTIICTRAGRDVISSLASGLLTMGDRLGGAINAAAYMFSTAYDSGLQPQDFVDDIHKKKKKIVGIGHDRFTVKNPDKRVLIIKDYVSQKFPAKPMVEFALEVEKITTSKKEGLILNIDGIIACAFVDMLKNSGHFSEEEAEKFISLGALNGIFALGRSIGLIGHYIDQRRLQQTLYTHPSDDITYIGPENFK